MELIGEEKRIRALFSEVRLADGQTAPSFAGVWNGAQTKTVRSTRAFNLSFVAATALLVCALVSLAWWSRHWQQRHDAVIGNVPSKASSTVEVVQPANNLEPVKVTQQGSTYKPRALKPAARRQAVLVAAGEKTLSDAKTIASWQSPTATLLGSSSDELLKSLPQLNQTVDELKSFLRDRPQ
jgi:hypothetical protein